MMNSFSRLCKKHSFPRSHFTFELIQYFSRVYLVSFFQMIDLSPTSHSLLRAHSCHDSKSHRKKFEISSSKSRSCSVSTKQGPLRFNAVSLFVRHCFLVYVVLLGAKLRTASGNEIPTCDYSTSDINEMNEKVKNDLLQRGFTVREGRFRVADSNLSGADPGNPYFVYVFLDASPATFELQPSSAVLFLGCTPSSPKYFSWRSYAFRSENAAVFASLGDSTNNLVINTSGSDSEDSGGKLTAIVTTADEQTLSTITTALEDAGAPTGIVNLDAVPSNRVDLFDDPSLNFMMLHRVTGWEDEEQKMAYASQIRPVLLIDPPSEQTFKPLGEVQLRPQGSGSPEDKQNGVESDLTKLEDAIINSMQSSSYRLVSSTTLEAFELDGFDCLENREFCRGDNRDTEYITYLSEQPFRWNDVYVFFGTDSVETDKCSHTSVGLYQVRFLGDNIGLLATNLSIDNRDMKNSASAFDVDNKKLVAYTMARNCGNVPERFREYCLEVGYNRVRGIPRRTSWGLIDRATLDPESKTAPLPSELVMSKVLKFKL